MSGSIWKRIYLGISTDPLVKCSKKSLILLRLVRATFLSECSHKNDEMEVSLSMLKKTIAETSNIKDRATISIENLGSRLKNELPEWLVSERMFITLLIG